MTITKKQLEAMNPKGFPAIFDEIPEEEFLKDLEGMQNYIDQHLLITDVEIAKGRRGEFCIISAIDEDGNEKHLSSGAWRIKAVVPKLKEMGKLPVVAYVEQVDNDSYKLSNPKTS